MRELFLLDPDVHFLNHGSFGACPIPVFEVYQNWQRELERQPVEFLARRSDDLLKTARTALGRYLNADPDDLVFVTNATIAENTIARSLKLEPGDEVLATNHEYGAVERTWRFICQKTGAMYINHPIAVPVQSDDAFIEQLWQGITPRTKVITISHITSPTSIIFPVAEVCRRAREQGILTVIDGAHAPGQIDVDLNGIQPDFYVGNCHKWMCTPKGAGFLYVRREQQALIDPLVISWGWQPGASFVDQNEWQGTRDIAAFLTVPAAIDFMHQHDWSSVRACCHKLALETRQRIIDLTGVPAVVHKNGFAQMFTAALPAVDVKQLHRNLYEKRVEVLPLEWNDGCYIRVSIQAYNTPDDVNALLDALAAEYTLKG